MTTLTHLECALCARSYDAGQAAAMCACGGPLLARYDFEKARQGWNREWIPNGPTSMWRYAPVLPVSKPPAIVSLGEGLTPLLRLERLGAKLGATDLWIKDEGVNPTGSFKARGLACAVSMARELGIGKLVLACGGNAAGALGAYAAAAGIEAHVFMPHDVSQAHYIECRASGAGVTLVEGAIGDCEEMAAARAQEEGCFDLSAFKEPYRIEGKKTIGYELAEQFRWKLPSAILYPTGTGVGLIGMWKAVQELESLGWISGPRPKLVAVQASGCAPIVRAFERGQTGCEPWEHAVSLASGLRVPKPLGDFLVLEAIRASGGTAIAVSDEALLDAGMELAHQEGILAAPEGAACLAALKRLLAAGFLDPGERIVVCNTGCGLKYLEAYSTRYPRYAGGEADKLGGLVTPR